MQMIPGSHSLNGAPIPHIRVFLFGRFRIEQKSSPDSLTSPDYQALELPPWRPQASRQTLAYLLCQRGRQCLREQILDALWPERDLNQARRTLTNALSSLRSVLRSPDGQCLLTPAKVDDMTPIKLAGQQTVWCDLDALQDEITRAQHSHDPLSFWKQAWELAQSDFLPEDRYADWTRSMRERVEGEARLCAWQLSACYRERGQLVEEERLLRCLLTYSSENEDVLSRLMECISAQGRTREAVHIYQRFAVLLREEEGREPARHIQDLAMCLSQQGQITHSPPLPIDQPVWSVPYQRNPFFTGRAETLGALRLILEQSPAGSQAVALCGLGGVGKTQAVLEYAYRSRNEYQAVFWIRADTIEHVSTDFLALATCLKLPERAAQDRTITCEAIKQWLYRQSGWLLIFDNADNVLLVRDVLPPGYQGHVLITTRAQATGGIARRLDLETMSGETGMLFLLRRAGLLFSDASLAQVAPVHLEGSRAVVHELGGLPLALDQAGAYIDETASSFQHYLNVYREERHAVLMRRGSLSEAHPEPVATTWSLSFDQVARIDPLAADILYLCSLLDPDAIAETLLLGGTGRLASLNTLASSDCLRFNEALGVLFCFSLVARNVETGMLTMHRLVQAVLQDKMDQATRLLWIEQTLRLVQKAFPEQVTMLSWPQCQQLLPHVRVCMALAEKYQLASPELGTLLNQAGYYLRERAFYQEAELCYQQALATREHLSGPWHPDIAQVCYNLARLYFETGQYALCEALHLRALAIRERTLPADSLDLARSLNSLAFTYSCWGRNEAEAERLFHRALSIYERAPGLDHPVASHCLSNLAIFYALQGKYSEAEQLLLRVQAIRERSLDALHLDIACSLQNLAWLCIVQRKQDHYERAKQLLERSLHIRQHHLGTQHPHVAISLHHLAGLSEVQQNYQEAERLYQSVLSIRRQTMSNDSPKVLLAEKHYARLLRLMQRPDEAASLEAHIQAVQEMH